MKKLLKILLCILLVLTFAPKQNAKADGEIENIHYNGDTLIWDAYPGAVYYNIQLWSTGDYVWIEEVYSNELKVEYTLNNYGMADGTYFPTRIEARDENDFVIAVGSSNDPYNYMTLGKVSSAPTNLRWDGTRAVWDPVSGADSYKIEFWHDGMIWDSTYSFLACMVYAEDHIIGDQYTWYFTVTAYRDGYERSERSEFSPGIKGIHQNFIRLAGASRYETSLLIAEEFKKVYNEKRGADPNAKLDSIFVATGKNYPDALSGSCLINDPNRPAPLLMINEKNAPKVVEFIRNSLNPDGTIYILGGAGVVPDEWLSSLSDFKIRRMAGKNRYETNLEVLKAYAELRFYPPNQLLVCTGEAFADALSCSALDYPMLLVNSKKGLSDSQKAYLSELSAYWSQWNEPGTVPMFYIIGGTGAVSAEIEAELANYGSVEDRIAGKDRYATSAAIARYYKFVPDRNEAVLATGKDFPDGLCAGPLAHLLHGPVLLVAEGHTEYASKYFGRHQIVVKTGYITGGTGAVTDEVACNAFNEASLH